MNENKRFTLQESDIYNRNDVIHDKGIEMPQSTVCDLLNEQDNEIQRCKLAYNQLSSYVDANFDEYMTQKKLNERIRELEQENKRLKQGKYVYGIHGGSND